MKTGQDRKRLLAILNKHIEDSLGLSDRGRDFKSVCRLFLEMLQGSGFRLVVLIDALDECSDPSSIVQKFLLPCVEQNRARFLVTGRPEVRQVFGDSPMSTIGMHVSNDIRKFVTEIVARNVKWKRHKEDIVATVSNSAEGMFRYAGEL